MNHVSTIVNGIGQGEHIGEAEGKRRTWAFVAGIMAMYYPDVRPEHMDGIKQTCILYHPAITGFSDKEYEDRLTMIRKICEVPNMPGLYGRYRNAQDALRVACGELVNLQHDFGIVQPKNYNTGELKRIAMQDSAITQTDIESGKKVLSQLKELL